MSYLQGSGYSPQEVNGNQTQSESRTVMTFEHASGHNWGGTFLFIDRLTSGDAGFTNDAMYGEFSLTRNIAKPGGFIKNVYITPQIEFGSGDNGADSNTNASDGNNFNNILLGVGVGLKVPGASFFNVALYQRFNDDQNLDNHLPVVDGDTTMQEFQRTEIGRSRNNNMQLTATWRYEFADARIRFDGFLDYVTAFDFDHDRGPMGDEATAAPSSSAAGFNFTPQLKFDLGRTFGMQPKKLWVGSELVYWQNKFGNEDWDETNFNLLLKWHF